MNHGTIHGMSPPCPLCESQSSSLFHESFQKNLQRKYWQCPDCDLVFVPDQYHLDLAAEKARYLAHHNDPNDPGYREFLMRLWGAFEPYISTGSVGLDYGSGPGPALAMMMREAGFDVRLYDPIFSPDRSVLESRYDFITCTETAEHFSSPKNEFQLFERLLKPGGRIGIMTGMRESWDGFPEWRYQRDETHLSFYSQRSMRWIAQKHGWNPLFPRENVVLFQKPFESCV